MISVHSKDNFSDAIYYLKNIEKGITPEVLKKYAEMGVDNLRKNTPQDSGKTADSWYYEIRQEGGSIYIDFLNSNVVYGKNIAILIDNGHATKNGTWVEGKEYIDKSIDPIIVKITKDLFIRG